MEAKWANFERNALLLGEFNIKQHCSGAVIPKNAPQLYGLDALSSYSLDQCPCAVLHDV